MNDTAFNSANPNHDDHCSPRCSNHHFSREQKAQYDSLNRHGRDAYDDMRWNESADHEDAFASAVNAFGLKEVF